MEELIAQVERFRRHSHGLTEALTVASPQLTGGATRADTNGGVDQATAETNSPRSEMDETSVDLAGRKKSWYEHGEADRAHQLLVAGAAPEEITWVLQNEEVADPAEVVGLAPQGPRRADDIGVDRARPWRFEASPD